MRWEQFGEESFQLSPLHKRQPGYVLLPRCYSCNCGCAIVRMTEANAIYHGGLWQPNTNDIVAASGNAGGLLLAPVYHPDGAYASRAMQATISATEAGTKLRLIPAYFDANGTQYGQKVAVEFEFGDETRCGVVRIITNPGNIEQIEGEQELSILVAARSHEVKVFYKVLNVDDPSYALVYAQVDNTITFSRTVEHFPNTQFGVEAWTSITGTGSFGAAVEITKYPNGKDDCIEVGCAIHNGLVSAHPTEEYSVECNWDVRSGTWTFHHGLAPIETATNGTLISHYPSWTDDDTVTLTVGVRSREFGVQADIIVDRVDDGNHHLVRVMGIEPALGIDVPPGCNMPSLTIIRVEAGVETTLESNGASDWYYVQDGFPVLVCVRGDGYITAKVGTISHRTERAVVVSSATTLHGGKQAGFSSRNPSPTYPLYFDGFSYLIATKCGDASDPERPCAICAPCDAESGYYGKLPNGLKVFASGIGYLPGGDECGTCLSLNGTILLPGFASRDDYRENGVGETLACKTMTKGGTAPCAGTGDSGVQATLFADRIEVLYFYHFDGGGYPMHTGKFVYYFTPEELCDLTQLVDGECVPEEVTDLACGFQNAVIYLSAL